MSNKTSAKKKITRSEYLQLIGLRAVADKYNALLKAIELAAYEITAELDHDEKPATMGHTSDFIYGGRDVDFVIEQLGLTVTDAAATPRDTDGVQELHQLAVDAAKEGLL